MNVQAVSAWSRLSRIRWLRKFKRALFGPHLPRHLADLEDVEGMISLEEADLLYRLATQNPAGECIVEIGSYRGRSTVALARGSQSGNGAAVFAIDPHETFRGVLGGDFGPDDRAAFFRAMLRTSAYRTVRLVNLTSEIVAPGWRRPVGLLWIDGDHTYAGVRRDWVNWSPHLTQQCRVAFDDALRPDLGPHRLISEITQDGRFRISDTVGKIVVLERVT